MSISYFFNKSVVVRRLAAVSGYKKSYLATSTMEMQIQQTQDDPSFAIYGALGATHKAWCDLSTDIKEEDQITDPDGKMYTVISVIKRDFGGQQHLEIILKELR